MKLLLIKCGSRKVTKDVIIRQKGSKMSKFGKIPANLTSTIEGVFRIGLKSFFYHKTSLFRLDCWHAQSPEMKTHKEHNIR